MIMTILLETITTSERISSFTFVHIFQTRKSNSHELLFKSVLTLTIYLSILFYNRKAPFILPIYDAETIFDALSLALLIRVYI
jgi:hypothetical protein